MKPLLVVPPSPARWPSIAELLAGKSEPILRDLEQRVARGVDGARDVFAVMPDGGRLLALACVHSRGETGVLAHAFTRPEHRRRGLARSLIGALTAWFDMVGGKRLYVGCDFELAEMYEPHGFRTLIRWQSPPKDEIAMIRGSAAAALDEAGGAPPAAGAAEPVIREVTRADWPLMVALLTHRRGPDPRAPLEETAAAAEATSLDLLDQRDRGTCGLLGSFRDGAMAGLASVALDAPGEHTYAMMVPFDTPMTALREAIIAAGIERGYRQVDFPLESIAPIPITPGPIAPIAIAP